MGGITDLAQAWMQTHWLGGRHGEQRGGWSVRMYSVEAHKLESERICTRYFWQSGLITLAFLSLLSMLPR